MDGSVVCMKCGAVEKQRVIPMEPKKPIDGADHVDAAWFYPKN
jgi:transcription initiation factor TFIIIB Brf1 subunit/transcription initiation factor TFIIB